MEQKEEEEREEELKEEEQKTRSGHAEGLLVGALVVTLPGTASLAYSVLRRPIRERKIPGSNPSCNGIFPGRVITNDFKIGTPVVTLAPGIIGSTLGLVGPMSV